MKKYLLSIILFSFLALLPSGFAATTYSTWDDATYNNGTFAWSDSSHWSNGIPSSGAALFVPVITHSTGDLLITTSTSLLVGYDPSSVGPANLAMNFTVNSGSLTFKFGNTFTTQGAPVLTNNTNDVSKLVFDVNGQSVSMAGLGTGTTYFTVKSSAVDGGGTLTLNQVLSAMHIDVRDNVTLKLGIGGTQNLNNSTFSSGSTIWYAGTGFGFGAYPTTAVGNVIVGSATNATLTYFGTNAGATYRVGGDFTLNKGTTANQDGYISFASTTTKIYVGGNFTDVGGSATSSQTNYIGGGLLAFNGGAGTQKSVSIGRTGLTNNFAVGESSSIAGNIGLAQSLTTTGSFTMYRGSRLNVAAFTLTAGTLNLVDDAAGNHITIADTFGTTNGLITTSGNLSLNTFNLQLTFDGTSWTNGSNLLLFHYGGTFTGTLALGTLTYFGPGTITSAGTLLNSGGNIYLQNVSVVPEPSSTALLLGAFGGMVVLTLRRKNRK